MATVEIENVEKQFGTLKVIPGLSLHIPHGSFTVLVGPSGCGKSTLLRMIAGLEDVLSGRIMIGDDDVTDKRAAKRGIAMVFQSYALYPHMTVYDNVGFSMKIAKVPAAEIDARVRKAAATLHLTDYLDRKPAQLSGGQRQRVAIGRAIVRNPKVFLFDEPLSNLDAALRTQMRVELLELHRLLGATMVYVTHDQVEAMTMADQIVVLNGGRIEQVGSPLELYDRPNTPFVASFIGSPKMNLLQGREAERHGADLVGIRPEHITLSSSEGLWPCRVRLVEQLGNDTIVYLESEAVGELTVKTSRAEMDELQDRVFATPQPHKYHLFRQGRRIEAAAGIPNA